MKRRITETQLRKLVYSQVKSLTEIGEQLPFSSPGQDSKKTGVDKTKPAVMDTDEKARLTKIQSLIKPFLGDNASRLAAAFSKVAKGGDLTNSDTGALAELAKLFINGKIDKGKLDEIIRVVRAQAQDVAKHKKEEQEALEQQAIKK